MVRSIWSMELLVMKVALRFVLTEAGEPSVMMVGLIMMLRLYADN